jgi:hypothetical protein
MTVLKNALLKDQKFCDKSKALLLSVSPFLSGLVVKPKTSVSSVLSDPPW